ncbi:methylenetetrahydrofolate reductase [Pseudonocardia sp. N23]|uniref:methylenetetrahydrofolate reductase n=1 Tax=Pseudonocardia sp. N23 TaxID=1987376 RepID=UPI000C0358EE|nr:methylenetetrahydrofolate reductase [Pseudonocardia sp. N23]GAY07977.1 5,10-methylenetetrahydrofolate reductase [Pseudonocardia sp. N23]
MTSVTDPQDAHTPSPRHRLARALRRAGYEVLPFPSAHDKVLAHVPREVPLTITTTEAKGLEPTLDLAVRLRAAGYRVSPHLAARLVRDKEHLVDIVDRLRDGGVDGVFVIGGDAAEPVGDFPDALGLLEALGDIGHPFTTVGVGGYPEGHGAIPDAALAQALADKAPHATHVVTQLCFDAAATTRWARSTALPVHVGVPGGYRADRLLSRLAPDFEGPVAGIHVFTFNDLDATETWRQNLLARLT